MASIVPAFRLRSAARPKQELKSSRTRRARKCVSYQEEASDESESDESDSQDGYGVGSAVPSPREWARTIKKQDAMKRKAESPLRSLIGGKKPKSNRGDGDVKQKEENDAPILFAGKTMPWATLPYQILATIFDYASRPLITEVFAPSSSMAWLLQAALTCRAFAEPALAALYYLPPLAPPSRAKALVDHLAAQNETSTFNYRTKIKYLEVEAVGTLVHKFEGHDPIDLGRLVEWTPQLRGIGIHLVSDIPKYRKAAAIVMRAGRPAYQDSLFPALEEGQIKLRDWTWNQSLARQNCSLASIKEIHTTSPYQTLRDISFVKYPGGPGEKGRRREDILVEAISVLPSLTGLHFRMSPIVNRRLMPNLPGCLQTLEIFDCLSLKSSHLSGYLTSKGRNLRHLILDHNPSLNLSFMTTLGVNCPKLELLKMDLRYFNNLFTIRSSDPKYDALFHKGEVPMWPTSLQRLEMFYLRRWSLGTAELFFSSLTQAASSLSDLRQIRIKACLEESGWRDRIGFRDKWTKKMQHVFQRKSNPPNPHLQSIAAYEAFKEQQRIVTLDSPPEYMFNQIANPIQSVPTCKNSSRLSHVEIPRASVGTNDTDGDDPLSKVRRSRRMRPRRDDMYTVSEDSSNDPFSYQKPCRRQRRRRASDDSSSEDSAIDDDGVDRVVQPGAETTEAPAFVQGMCDVVDVSIDNLRPTEEQLKEEDFLDDEPSGDEDWNGDDNLPGDGGYAW